MKNRWAFLRGVLVALAVQAGNATAEDIDIYSGGGIITGNKPNVVVLLDNTANWSPVFAAEKNALVTAVSGLQTGDFRMGLMMFTETGAPNSNVDGAYVRYHAREMNDTNKENLSAIVNGLDVLADKSNSGKLGLTMYEVYAYLAGGSAYAGHNKEKADPGAFTSESTAGPTYRSPVSGVCQKNFVIYISNGPVQDNSSDTSNASGKLSALGGDVTTISLNPNSSETNIGDEYARFLNKTADLRADLDDRQFAITYTVDVLPGSTGQGPGHTALLKSMAAQGGGEYFAITEDGGDVATQLIAVLKEILLEIQAVNSVFTSASLPVSVNTQGTYLNQIYIGMFRPDGQSKPRWLGNLKQYKLARDANTGSVFLADKNGTGAVNATTGFVSPNAVSFWTTQESTPDTGYWKGMPYGEGGAGGAFNSPDGDIVEKGGVAQVLRQQFADGRSVFTCYPACTADTAPLQFATTNANLLARFAPGSPLALATLFRLSGADTAYASTSAAHGLSVGDDITIANVDVSGSDGSIPGTDYANYNGKFKVASVIDSTHFTYTVVTSPTSPGTGTNITAGGGVAVTSAVSGVTYDAANSVAVVTKSSHGLISGQVVTIAGASPSAYNGTYTVTVKDANSFTYAPTLATAETPAAVNQSGLALAMSCVSGTTQAHTLEQIFRPAGTTNTTVFAVTAGNSTNGTNKCQVGASANLTGPSGYAGTYAIVACPAYAGAYAMAPNVNNRTFCFKVSIATSPVVPSSPATGAITMSATPTYSVAKIERSLATVTVTTAVPHTFVAGNSIRIAGVNETEYNGTFTIGSVTANTFRYSISYQRPGGIFDSDAWGSGLPGFEVPAARLSSATMTRGNTVDAASLINWVRGQDIQDEYARADVTGSGVGNTTEVRPSIHGDVLHSRPVVIDYGTTEVTPAETDANGDPVKIGQIAFYGANDGTFRAVRGGQESNGGAELWSFVVPETFDNLERLYTNSPVVQYFSTPSGVSPPPKPRAYFADGSVGAYQELNPDGTVAKVYVYLSGRRGGRFVYALDVTDPDSPKYLWHINEATAGFAALGQTWSTPKVTTVKGNTNPVVIFGAGYDAAQEDKAPGSTRNATMGYGVFVVDAFDGTLIRHLNPFGGGDTKYSFASDVTVVDTDFDGFADRLYVGDTGANLWRFDVDAVLPTDWAAFKLAALGGTGVNDRKFLYAPEVVLTSDFAAVMAISGNREYPIDIQGLRPGVTTVVNRAYFIKDTFTGKSASGMTPVVHVAPAHGSNTLVAVTDPDTGAVTDVEALSEADGVNPVDITAPRMGWFLSLSSSGEKGVNAPLSLGGVVFFGSNQPVTPSPNSCTGNLGVARGYAVNIFTGTAAFDRDLDGVTEASDLAGTFSGGGLPPSPVSGTVMIDGEPVRFVIGSGGIGVRTDDEQGGGGGGPGNTCGASSLDACDLSAVTTGPRKRTFWYMTTD